MASSAVAPPPQKQPAAELTFKFSTRVRQVTAHRASQVGGFKALYGCPTVLKLAFGAEGGDDSPVANFGFGTPHDPPIPGVVAAFSKHEANPHNDRYRYIMQYDPAAVAIAHSLNASHPVVVPSEDPQEAPDRKSVV